MLHASCLALLDAHIQPVNSPWFATLDQALGTAQALTSSWRSQGMAYHQECMVDAVVPCGTHFAQMQPDIETLFTQLEQHYNMATQLRLSAALATLQGPTQAVLDQAQAYAARLRTFEQQMAAAQGQMQQTVSDVQAPDRLSDDQHTVATLNGLTMSASLVLADLHQVARALDALRTSWVVFNGELGAVIQRLQQAQAGQAIVVDHTWFKAACLSWAQIVQQAPSMCQGSLQSRQAVSVG
jgi:hypothetical protein